MNQTIKKKYTNFLNKFTVDNIAKWSDPKEYVVGYGKSNKSFCYYVEYELKELGDIRGANSSKFGLWCNEKTKKICATKKNFNRDPVKAFELIKEELINIINKAKEMTTFADFNSILSNSFRYKIIYLYNPDIIIPCFNHDDMRHFEREIGQQPSNTYELSQKNLLDYKNDNYANIDNYEFMVHLYKTYGKSNISKTVLKNKIDDLIIDELINSDHKLVDKYVAKPLIKTKSRIIDGRKVFERNKEAAIHALIESEFKCEMDCKHGTFIRKSNGQPYLECHHLIPLCFQHNSKFKNCNLDVPENIVILCSTCHNEIHYGKNNKDLIKQLYKERLNKIKSVGINITLNELCDLYDKQFRKKDI